MTFSLSCIYICICICICLMADWTANYQITKLRRIWSKISNRIGSIWLCNDLDLIDIQIKGDMGSFWKELRKVFPAYSCMSWIFRWDWASFLLFVFASFLFEPPEPLSSQKYFRKHYYISDRPHKNISGNIISLIVLTKIFKEK